jgi:hypothetical protein
MEEVILVKPVEDTDKELHEILRKKIKKIQAYGALCYFIHSKTGNKHPGYRLKCETCTAHQVKAFDGNIKCFFCFLGCLFETQAVASVLSRQNGLAWVLAWCFATVPTQSHCLFLWLLRLVLGHLADTCPPPL